MSQDIYQMLQDIYQMSQDIYQMSQDIYQMWMSQDQLYEIYQIFAIVANLCPDFQTCFHHYHPNYHSNHQNHHWSIVQSICIMYILG